jgi:hypothetical protein
MQISLVNANGSVVYVPLFLVMCSLDMKYLPY